MTRAEHVEWCKKRALEYIEQGDLKNAYASMASDMIKHEETREHPAIDIGFMMMMSGQLSTVPEMRKFIVGFN